MIPLRGRFLRTQQRNYQPAQGGEGGTDEDQRDKAGLIVQPAAQRLRAAAPDVQGGHQEGEDRSLNAGRAGAGRKIEHGQMRNLRNKTVAEKNDDRRPRTA